MSRNPSEAVTRAWIRLNRARDRVLGAIEHDLKTGGCPPLALMPLLVVDSCGAFPPRRFKSRKPVATAMMTTTTARMRMKMIERMIPVSEQFCDDFRRGAQPTIIKRKYCAAVSLATAGVTLTSRG